MHARIMAFLVTVGAAATISAQLIVPYPYYPRLDRDPSMPVAGDTVRLHYVKGRLPDDCLPSYSDETVRIEMSPLAIYPPQYVVYLSYAESEPAHGCAGDSVEYGPAFVLANVPVGSYEVRDGMNGDTTVGSFTVSEPLSIQGVVTDDPGTYRRMPKPLENVLVQVATDYYPRMYAGEAGAPVPWYYPHFYDTTRTAADGSYALSRVPQGTYRVTFSGKGYITQNVSLTLARDTVLNVKLLPEGAYGTVSGTVHVAVPGPTPTSPVTFAPCARCTVTVFPECNDIIVPLSAPMSQSTSEAMLCLAYDAVTDKDGRFLADSIYVSRSGEPITVTARKSGYMAASVDTAIHYMIPTEVNLVLIPETLDAELQPSPESMPGVRFVESARAVRVTLDSRQALHVSLHTLDGRRVSGVASHRVFGAGMHSIPLPAGLSPGVYLVRVRGATVDATIRARVQ